MAAVESTWAQDIAVVGISCRFPDEADTFENFWDYISKGRTAYSENPERWNPDAFHFPGKKINTSLTRGGHFLKNDVAAFDAKFFNINKVEAESMDPQQRMVMECTYEAMENAGLPIHRLAGTRTGCWMGNFTSDYRETLFRDPEAAPMYTGTGTSSTSVSNRVSWFFDFKGPSFTLDTACSSTMVAVHLAVQSLSIGESSAAIVGGSNLMLNPDMFFYLSNQQFLAKDGKSKAFDESGDGYGRGEGVAVIVLKRMADALADGDPIRAVIRGTAINQDGHTKGLTLPSADAQEQLILDAYRNARVSMEETRYVEAHGTGTQAGDKCETEALSRTICKYRTTSEPLLVGSVKANIGHLEAAAGMAALLKCIGILETGMIPPTPSCKKANPAVKWNEWRLRVPVMLTRWPTKSLRRVSAQGFGYGGTNAHVVLDDAYHYLEARSLKGIHNTRLLDAPVPSPNGTLSPVTRLFPLSAQDKDGLKRVRAALSRYLTQKADNIKRTGSEDSFLRDLAYTLYERRSRLQWQTFAAASSIDDLYQLLQEQPWSNPEVRSATQAPRLGFIFTGQGAQWARMGVELMEYEVFRQSVEESDRYLRQELGCAWSAVEELAKPDSSSLLGLASYSQALCSILQIALVDLLATWNVAPSAVAGHSSGEIAAAYCLGALSREDALKAAYFRGILSAQMKEIDPSMRGAMMAVGATPVEVEKWLAKLTKGTVVIACVNSPTSVTVSGDEAGVDELEAELKEAGIFARKLKVDTAYHSHHMQTIAAQYFEAIADISTSPAKEGRHMHSSVIGGAISAEELGPANWVRNLVSTVQFADAVHDLLRPLADGKRATENAVDILVEVGPHSALQGPLSQTMNANGITGVKYLSALSRGKHAVATALACAGTLFGEGVPVEIRNVNQDLGFAAQPLLDLPTYPWNHSIKYWAESRVGKEYRLRKHPRHPLLGSRCPAMGVHERLWRGFVRADEETWVRDHVIQGSILYPAAGFLAMAIEGARQEADGGRKISGFRLRDMKIDAALVIEEDTEPEVTLSLRPHLTGTLDTASSWMEFTVSSCTDGHDLRQNCSGLVMVEYEALDGSPMSLERAEETRAVQDQFLALKKRCSKRIDVSEFYTRLAALGLTYGPAFANLTEVHTDTDESRCVSRLAIPDIESKVPPPLQDRPHIIHPGTLDAIFHLAFAALCNQPDALKGAMVPMSIEEIVVSANVPYHPGAVLQGYAHSARHGFRDLLTDIEMLDEQAAKAVVHVRGFQCVDVSGTSDQSDEGESAGVKPITCQVAWKPAIELLSLEELHALISQATGGELNEYLTLLHHSNPGLSILEIGLRNGESAPVSVVSQLKNAPGILNTAKYVFAVREETMLQAVAEQFGGMGARVSFQVRDLEKEVKSDDTKFDLVIASNLSSASQRPETIVSNASKLLKEKARICLVESIEDKANPCEPWLERAGLVKEISGEYRQFCLVTGATPTQSTAGSVLPAELVLVEACEPSPAAQNVASRLADELVKFSISTSRFRWGSDVSELAGKSCIVLTDLEKAVLLEASSDDFHIAQQLILQAGSLLWVSGSLGPESHLVSGMARTIRNEVPGIKFQTLQINGTPLESVQEFTNLVLRVLQSSVVDDEFIAEGGLITVSRYIEDRRRNETLATMLGQQEGKAELMPLSTTPGPVKLSIMNPGMLDSLCFEPDLTPEIPLLAGEVEVEVKASGVNFRDVMVAMGQIPDKLLGFEAAGLVRRIGDNVTNVKVGDRVAMLAHGSHRTIHRVRSEYAIPIPETMSFEEAAGVMLVHGTAWYALMNIAHIQKGQSILIHAAAGGVGQAAVMLAQHIGLEIFATVGSDDKKKLIQDLYAIPTDHIFNSRDLSFVKGVKRMTGGRGVDVVLNSLAGEALRQTWYCIAPFGTFVEIGMKDILTNTRLDMRPFLQDAHFAFFNLNRVQKERPELMTEVLNSAMALLSSGATRPVWPLTSYPVSQVEDAFRIMQAGKHRGKLTLTFSPSDVVPVLSSSARPVRLDEDASYILVGGLGGLGRSLSRLFVRLGAKRLCFFSRSGAASKEAQQLVEDLRRERCQILVVRCDVSDPGAVANAVQQCTTELGPVRGVVQGAMVLQDALFEKMTYRQWIESTRPKVQGSWNLHMNLPEVDFFLTLSSFAGIFGNRGQSNYAAAGAYEDALAQYRRSCGLKAVALDLGIMRDVGVLAETGITDNLREWEEPCGIRESEFHALVENALADELNGQAPVQIPTGFATALTVQQAGISTPFFFDDPRFWNLAHAGASQSESAEGGAAKTVSVQSQLAQATSVAEATTAVMDALVARVAKSLQSVVSDIDTSRPLHAFGVDSLVAVEVANWVFREIKAKVTVFDILSSIPITALAEKIAMKSSLLRPMSS